MSVSSFLCRETESLVFGLEEKNQGHFRVQRKFLPQQQQAPRQMRSIERPIIFVSDVTKIILYSLFTSEGTVMVFLLGSRVQLVPA